VESFARVIANTSKYPNKHFETQIIRRQSPFERGWAMQRAYWRDTPEQKPIHNGHCPDTQFKQRLEAKQLNIRISDSSKESKFERNLISFSNKEGQRKGKRDYGRTP